MDGLRLVNFCYFWMILKRVKKVIEHIVWLIALLALPWHFEFGVIAFFFLVVVAVIYLFGF